MNDMSLLNPNDDYGAVTATDTVRLERLLPGPAERLWRYLTEPDLRAQWLAGGDMTLQVGGAVELVFRHKELSSPDDDAPPSQYGAAESHRLQGHITACEPPLKLAYTWAEQSDNPSEVCFELTPKGDEVLLVVTHTRLASRDGMLSVSTGWHTHLAILRARLENSEAPLFWHTFSRLKADYERRLA